MKKLFDTRIIKYGYLNVTLLCTFYDRFRNLKPFHKLLITYNNSSNG